MKWWYDLAFIHCATTKPCSWIHQDESTIKWKGSVWDQVSGCSTWTNPSNIHWLYLVLCHYSSFNLCLWLHSKFSVQLKEDKVLEMLIGVLWSMKALPEVDCFSVVPLIRVNSTYSAVKKFSQSADFQVGHFTVCYVWGMSRVRIEFILDLEIVADIWLNCQRLEEA